MSRVFWYWLIVYFILVYSTVVLGLCALMFTSHLKRLRNADPRNLAAVKYTFNIVWHTTIVKLTAVISIILLTAALLFFPVPPRPSRSVLIYGLVRLVISCWFLTVMAISSVLDNPTLNHGNDTLEEDYEKDVMKGVKKVIVR